MALFKPYYGTTSELENVSNHEGYVYITTDDGLMSVDIGGKRYQLNAVKANQIGSLTESDIEGGKTASKTATLSTSGWTKSGNYYQQTVSWTDLTCGPAGITPPDCVCTDNTKEYSLISYADATAGTGVTFYTENKPSAAITVIITDRK